MAEKNFKFGELLSDLIEEDGLNNRELAKIVGVRPSSIGNYRSGREPQAHILEKLADYFKITSKELRSGEKTLEPAGGYVKDSLEAGYERPEEQSYVDKLLEVLRGDDEQGKELIKSTIDILTKKEVDIYSLNYDEWVGAGRPERRKEARELPPDVESDRRAKLHVYG